MDQPHRRYNPLTGEWVLVSPQRARRPWLGQVEKKPDEGLPAYDPQCYLCPGNPRVGGIRNPDYKGTYVFDNDFPALLHGEEIGIGLEDQPDQQGLLRIEPVSGLCRVVCFSPRHDLTIPELTPQEMESVLYTWSEQTMELGSRPDIRYVQVFENKGAVMGCSNPHPHSQIWSTSYIPNEPAKEMASMQAYQSQQGSCLLCDYMAEELHECERVTAQNQHFIAVIPFWAVWPFEILVISRRHIGSLTDLEVEEVSGLARMLQEVTAKYDNLFEISFPYSMGFHQSPTDGLTHPEAHLHLHFYPPLLRSATVRKFMVGFEMLAMPQRDFTPEAAAERLRGLSSTHYKSIAGVQAQI